MTQRFSYCIILGVFSILSVLAQADTPGHSVCKSIFNDLFDSANISAYREDVTTGKIQCFYKSGHNYIPCDNCTIQKSDSNWKYDEDNKWWNCSSTDPSKCPFYPNKNTKK